MQKKSLLASLPLLFAACSPYAPELGNQPYLCPEDECPDGYTCETTTDPAPRDKVCVATGGMVVDSGVTGFQCAMDGTLEPNETPQTAYMTDVGTAGMRSFGPLSICPEGDKDIFAAVLPAGNMGFEVTVTWESGQPISMSILNAGGTSIVNGVAMGDKGLRACAPNLPAGTYYGSVFAAGSTKNNYRITLKLVPNCAS